MQPIWNLKAQMLKREHRNLKQGHPIMKDPIIHVKFDQIWSNYTTMLTNLQKKNMKKNNDLR